MRLSLIKNLRTKQTPVMRQYEQSNKNLFFTIHAFIDIRAELTGEEKKIIRTEEDQPKKGPYEMGGKLDNLGARGH